MVGTRLRAKLSGVHAVYTAGRHGAADLAFDLEQDAAPAISDTFDVIVHCAASFGGDTTDDMLRNEQVNSAGAFRVARLAQQTSCAHVVYLSTISSYEQAENGYFGSYGLSKRHGQENLDLWCRNAGIAFTSLLPSQIYDETGEARKHQPLLYHFLECARRGEDVSLFGSADPLRNYLFVGDLVDAIERVVTLRAAGVFPCLGPDSLPVSAIAQLAMEVFGTTGRVSFLPDKPNLRTVYLPHDDSLYSATGYRPLTGLREGMARFRDYVGTS
jgi:nucleoside-diphosphate-sugar epimerase